MRTATILFFFGLIFTVAEGCSKASAPTSPTPVAVVPPSAPLTPTLTLEPDSNSPVGEAVAITYASRAQEPGKIAIAVTGFNLRNQRSPTAFGLYGVVGAVRLDDALLEYDAFGFGDLLGGNEGAFLCDVGGIGASFPEAPGIYPFCILSRSRITVTGSGELFLLRFKPRPGVTSGTTRVDFVPFQSNGYRTTLDMLPGPSTTNKIQNTYGATITIRPGS